MLLEKYIYRDDSFLKRQEEELQLILKQDIFNDELKGAYISWFNKVKEQELNILAKGKEINPLFVPSYQYEADLFQLGYLAYYPLSFFEQHQVNRNNLIPSSLFSSVPSILEPYILALKDGVLWSLLAIWPSVLQDIVFKAKKEGFSELREGLFVSSKNIEIAEFTTFKGINFLSSNVEVRPGAYLRGGVFVGENSTLGNSSELKNSILFNKVAVPHYNYVGDSILGNQAHLGAGVVLSNLKLDRQFLTKEIKLLNGQSKRVAMGLRKVGGFLADGVEIGCNSVVNPATIVGKKALIYPLSSVSGIIDSGERYKA